MSRSSYRILLFRFLTVGSAGFLIDILSFQLIFIAGGGLVFSRILSALIAMTATWYMNRHLVFETHGASRRAPEYVRYLTVQTIGLATSFGVYFLTLYYIEPLRSIPAIALAAGSAAAVTFNFLGAKLWVFRREGGRVTVGGSS